MRNAAIHVASHSVPSADIAGSGTPIGVVSPVGAVGRVVQRHQRGVVGVRRPFVRLAIAVVVEAVAEFGRARVAGGAIVVAVVAVRNITAWRKAGLHRVGGIAVAVAVCVGVETEQHAFVRQAVAVIVQVVTDFGRAWVDGATCDRMVVAVGAVGNITAWRRAGLHRGRSIAVAVAICVGVEAEQYALVRLAVAVVVFAVADFSGAGVASGAVVVAVGVVGHITAWRRAGLDRGGGVAVAIAVRVSIEAEQQAFVRLPVAVVVFAVADFGGAGVTSGADVVAVGVVGNITVWRRAGLHRVAYRAVAVAVIVGVEGDRHAFVRLAVAVVVNTIADFGGAGVDGGVAVVTIARGKISIPVVVNWYHVGDGHDAICFGDLNIVWGDSDRTKTARIPGGKDDLKGLASCWIEAEGQSERPASHNGASARHFVKLGAGGCAVDINLKGAEVGKASRQSITARRRAR